MLFAEVPPIGIDAINTIQMKTPRAIPKKQAKKQQNPAIADGVVSRCTPCRATFSDVSASKTQHRDPNLPLPAVSRQGAAASTVLQPYNLTLLHAVFV